MAKISHSLIQQEGMVEKLKFFMMTRDSHIPVPYWLQKELSDGAAVRNQQHFENLLRQNLTSLNSGVEMF